MTMISWFSRRTTSPATDVTVEERTQAIGRELLAAARGRHNSIFSARFWSDWLMQWAMQAPAFRTQLFRFVDVFPMLRTPEQVRDYLEDYLVSSGVALPSGMGWSLRVGRLAPQIMARTVAKQITAMASLFIAGREAADALSRLRALWDQGTATSVDLLGEACVSQAEADAYRRRYLDLIETLPDATAAWPTQPRLDLDHVGPVPRASVSIKLSALSPKVDAIDFDGSVARLLDAIRPILDAAARRGVMLYFDMEQYGLKELTLAVFERACMESPFHAGIALQAYLRSGEQDAQRLIDFARQSGRQLSVRLIKGAYWDYELVQAEARGWPVPVWTRKADTDACFERMAEMFVSQMPHSTGESGVKLALGSHNVRSIAHTLALLEAQGLPQSAVELQMLYGMADQLKGAALDRGLRLREYVPLGELIPGMAYLVRRLLENTSNQSWLRAGFAENASDEELLRSPHVDGDGAAARAADPTNGEVATHTGGASGTLSAARNAGASGTVRAARQPLVPSHPALADGRPFGNEPQRDFADAGQREGFREALRHARAPEIPAMLSVEEARAAVGHAAAAFPAWRDWPAIERSRLLIAAAGAMRSRRDELSGIITRESGKTWREADADVCEAIDFAEFYARAALPLFEPQRLGDFAAESNDLWYQPRGVALIVSPWNFPLAICAGMTLAALATGNCALVKPAGATPAIAYLLCEFLWQAGVPRDVLQFVHGAGRGVGPALVRDPRVALIAFTGSRDVGLDILSAAGQTAAEQTHVKRVICEMGGKNAIIVDESADLDEAVLAVRHSAFSYAGQKCSACSRVIVVEGVYAAFLRRLIEATRALVIGDPADPATDVGPIIDERAAAGIRRYIEIALQEGQLELACAVPAGLAEAVGKPYIGPHIFSGIRPEHRLAQEEVFGPVLAVMRAADFSEALALANGTGYKLAGGVFSRKPARLQQARREFRVGNLYLNRGITGALVGRQPFGGFGLSGGGTKAGGREYLLHFVDPRACCENTLRHGFAPLEE